MKALTRCGTVLFVALAVLCCQPLQAQELGVVRVQSLDKVFDGVEAIAQAAGQPVDRQMMLGGMLGMIGIESADLLDMSKPLAVVLPVEGMMLQQKGLVAALPVTDVAAAIAAVEGRFATHTSEDKLHTFATDQGPALYLLESDGYIRIGSSSNLVTKFDPLAGPAPASAISLEIFLEPVAPMIQAGLEAGRQQIKTKVESDTAGQEVPVDPQAVASMIDLYIDGIGSVVSNTSSFRLELDVKDGYIRFSDSLIPKQGSALAQFTAAQQGAAFEIARFADPGSALFMVGNITMTDELRAGFKKLAHSYLDLVGKMFNPPANEKTAAAETGETEEAASGDTEPAAQPGDAMKSAFWGEYIDIVEPFADRWVDCFRGDFAMTFDFTGKVKFFESFGLTDPNACQELHTEMVSQMQETFAQSSELGSVFSISDGPKLGKSQSVLMTMDTKQLAKAMDMGSPEEVEKAMQMVYGDAMSFSWVSFDEWFVVTGGDGGLDLLQAAYDNRKKKATLPSFAPLGKDLSVLVMLDLGRLLGGLQGIVPEGGEKVAGLAQALSGETGRIPMGLRFDTQLATCEVAVSLQTVEAIASFTAQMKAEEAAAAAEAESDSSPEDTEE